ncbi:cupin domain-containing protein [Deinococcus sp. Marseille-Q6407]|uniref:cupin domain-containing protein n=1 Tax=Deinococcus sp. Marseille-Q6407 TaxID=2969223 RepID=UPI0021C245BB|nr:cupin domain-containing protein [Deinococcus sp. Marseille-Q6407]
MTTQTVSVTLPVPSGQAPNNQLAARLYPAALTDLAPEAVRQHLLERDWSGSWQGGIYPFHHYHSTAHEALAVLRGQAQVILGGAGGPQLTVQAGDVLLLPAGTGHCCPSHSADFGVMGAYAGGREWDLCRPDRTDLAWAERRIAGVPGWKQEPA